jgi:cyanate permease
MLALLWLLYASFGLVFRSIPPLVTPMLKDLHMSYGEMGFVLGSWQLTYIVFALLSGIMIDKWGVRKSLLLGITVIGLSSGLRYFAQGFGTLLPIVALFGVGGPLISVGSPKAAAQWFQGRDRGFAVGIYMTGPWIGGVFALAATNRFVMPLMGYSWRLTFVSYALLTMMVAALWWLFAKDPPLRGDRIKVGVIEVFSRLVGIRSVRIVLMEGLLVFAVMHGYTNWLPKILEISGMSPSMAGFTSSLPLITGIPAMLLIPSLVPSRLRSRAIGLLALVAGASILVWSMASGTVLLVGLGFFGVAGSGMIPLLILILMETPDVGSRYMGSAGGIFFCVSDLGGFIGPSVMGALVDATGSFFAGTFFLVILCIVVFFLTFLLKTPAVSCPGEST